MLVELLSSLFFISNIFLILLVVMQKNYGGFWSGPSGSDSVMLFGGNQGADILQKLTWIFGLLLIFGSLSLSIYEASSSKVSKFYIKEVAAETTIPSADAIDENQSESIKEETITQKKEEEKKAKKSDLLEVEKNQNKDNQTIAKKDKSNTKK